MAQPKVHEGTLDAAGRRVAVIAGRYNDVITRRLVDAAVDCLSEHGADLASVDLYWVPGSFEVPQMASMVSRTGRVDGIVCLGTIIRGETNHFDILSDSVIRSIASIAREDGTPVTYGIITAETFEQAMNRAGGRNGDKTNKGRESTLALIQMMSLREEERRGQEA